MSTKSKSHPVETPAKRASIPKFSKAGVPKSDADSSSPRRGSRLSVDRSPRSVASKPTAERRPTKLTARPDKQSQRVMKGSLEIQTQLKGSLEIQTQLSIAQEELRTAKEKLDSVEKDKAKAMDELKEAQRLAEEVNEKLKVALVAQRSAEENIEIEKFRAVEMEQVSIEAARKKEEEWKRELETAREKHAVDVAALRSATQELQRTKEELAAACGEKDRALEHVDDANKIADMHSEKVGILSAEVARLKALLDSRLQSESNGGSVISELKLEIDTLKHELDKATGFEEKLTAKEATVEQLKVELEAVKMAEYSASCLAEEWKWRAEQLRDQVDEARRSERSASGSLQLVMKQLEESNDSLQDGETEISSLKEKLWLLEISVGRQRGELEEAERRLRVANDEVSRMAKKVESLEVKLEALREEKNEATNNENLAAASVRTLLEEKNRLITELQGCREEEEKSKKAMESLASALHEVSSDAREAREKQMSHQAEYQKYENQIEDLNHALRTTKDKYKRTLDVSKHEIDILISSIEQYKHEHHTSKVEWEEKELHLISCVRKSEEESSRMNGEISRLVNLLQDVNEETFATKEEGVKLKNALEEAESDLIHLKDAVGDAEAERIRLKEDLKDKENMMRCVVRENEELKSREAVALKKVEELAKLLAEAVSRKQAAEDRELTECEQDYDMLPKVVEFSEQNGNGKEKRQTQDQKCDQPAKGDLREKENGFHDGTRVENLRGEVQKNVKKEKKDNDSAEEEYKMWEGCKIEVRDFYSERKPDEAFFEEELDSKTEDGSESYDQINGQQTKGNLDIDEDSPQKQQNMKKKKPLLHKFGNFLKKKGSH